MIVDRINRYLTENNFPDHDEILNHYAEDAKYVFDRQFGVKEEREPGIYLSSIGKCLRQQAYKLKGEQINGKEMDSRAKMVFFQGDMAELAIIYLARLAGCWVSDCQRSLKLEGITGHPDGVLSHDGKEYLLEIKSMSSYGFAKFEKGDIDESYIYQINAYMEALQLDSCLVVAMNKDSGVLGEKVINKTDWVVSNIKKRINILQNVNGRLPAREHTPDDKGYLPWNCRYCSYFKTCYPGSELVLSGRSYKLKVKKEKTDETRS